MSEMEGLPVGEALAAAQQWLGAVEVGDGLHHRNLTVFPLETGAAPGAGSERYTLLSDAIEAGNARVEEVSEGGQVPLLAVVNGAVQPILVPEGEILVGGKQNRTINLTLLVAIGKTFQVPVSCVEQGRWRYASRESRAEAYAMPRMRQQKVFTAQRRRAAGGGGYADQGAVWESVDESLGRLSAPSPTRDMVDGFRASRARLREYRDAIRLPATASGLVAASDGRVIGMDLFDAPGTLANVWPRLGDAYFLQAVTEPECTATRTDVAQTFVTKVSERLQPADEQPELGVEFELAGDDVTGAALWYDGALCHLVAFESQQAPRSWRRRYRSGRTSHVPAPDAGRYLGDLDPERRRRLERLLRLDPGEGDHYSLEDLRRGLLQRLRNRSRGFDDDPEDAA